METVAAVTSSPHSSKNLSSTASTSALDGLKPKQTKSRNGCQTCKAKRLKCDETKPTCRQCQKRNVTCGGYRKHFKWKSFEKSSFAKPSPKGKKAGAGLMLESWMPSMKTADALTSQALQDSIAVAEDEAAQHRQTCSPVIAQEPLAVEVPTKGIAVPWVSIPTETIFGVDDIALDVLDISLGDLADDGFADAPRIVTPTMAFDELLGSSPLTSSEDDEVGYITPHSTKRSNCSWNAAPFSPAVDPKTFHGVAVHSQPAFPSGSPEMLLMRFDRHTCGILSVKDGSAENPWRTLIWPLATHTPSLYHAICSLAAFHWSKAEPRLRVNGMEHMRESVKSLAMNIRNMRTDTALATTLALAFAEAWDRHTSSGVQHLRGAGALVSQALALQRRNALQRSDLSRLRFLYNTWMYISVLAKLTSTEDVEFAGLSCPFPSTTPTQVHEVDPLMGCATTLFPLIGRVADLVQKVRAISTNSIAIISQAIELKTLIEQWEPPRYFEPPEDPTSSVQHSYQTAQAYRWATLLHLHRAVPEIPSEPAAELAKRVLVLLATVPPSSRATIVHIYPLLVASCEVESEEDRIWVRKRWEAMQARLMVGNIDRCIDVVEEVWARRDEHELRMLEDERADPTRKRISTNTETSTSNPPQTAGFTFCDHPDHKSRRFSADDIEVFGSDPPSSSWVPTSVHSRKMSMNFDNVEYEKSVRGRLHWAGVMRDWNWEVLLG
ncbi:hypothetical protein VTO42DRAFT_7784 [Malbranchea cinnamomea]